MLVLISTAVAAVVGIPAGILAFRRPRLGRPLSVRRQRRANDSEPRAVRLSAAAPVHRRRRTAHGARDAHALRAAADRPHDGRRPAEPRSGGRRGRRGHGHDVAAVAVHGGAAARAAVDRRRPSCGDGDRRRHGDDCRGDRRGRARRIHFSRVVDGRHDDHPRRRDSGGGAGARRRRRSGLARAPASIAQARGRRLQGPDCGHRRDRDRACRRRGLVDVCRRLTRRPLSSARRISPSRWCWES